MAEYSVKDVEAATKAAEDAASKAMDATGETGENTGLSLENKEKKKKSLKETVKSIGEKIKKDPAGTIGAAAAQTRQPLREYASAQRQKQRTPTAEEMVPERINLAEAFNI